MSVYDLFARSGAIIGDDVGTITASELAAQGAELASAWASAGMQTGDRVAFRLANGRRYLLGLVAAAVGGQVVVAVNTRWSDDEAQRLIDRSGARWLLSDRPGAGASLTPAPASSPGPVSVNPVSVTPAPATAPYAVFTTSGTTSEPKMVLHTQASIAAHGPDVAAAMGHGPDTRAMVVMPLCGVFGLAALISVVAGGATIHLPASIDPVEVAATVEAERIDVLHGSDDLFHRMLATDHDLSSLAVAGYARFNSSLDGIVDRAEARGMRLTGLYGMSEVQALYAYRDASGPLAQRQVPGGTVVSPSAGARVVEGELQLTGPSLFAGYLAEGGAEIDQALTAAAFTEDGWLRTGDAAEAQDPVDGRDTFAFTARMGDVLRLGGFLVAPAEIESVVLELDGIEEAQVVAVDRQTGARPVAVITGPEPPAEADVIAHCQARLALFKCPVAVIHLDALPTTPSANGTKIQKVKLRELAANALSPAETPAEANERTST